MRIIARFVVAVVAIAGVGMALAHAQEPGVVVTTAAPDPNNWADTAGDATWALAALGCVNRFLSVLERIVTDTRGWADRWLDKTNGKIRIDYKRTGVTIPWAEADPDRTGEVNVKHNRRKTDRNGTSPDLEDDEDH